MKLALVAGALVAAALILYLLKRTEPNPPLAATDPPPIAAKPAEKPPLAKPEKIEHGKLETKAERQQLAEQIATAQAARSSANHAAPRPPSLPANPTLDPDRPDDMKSVIRTTMREAIPLLADCYDKASSQLPEVETKIAAKLTLISDPDVGTIIDAHQISDDQGRPLLASFDDCLRDTMQQLALPPIANGTIDVTYPFVFHK